jgi:Beta-lactamase
MRIKTIALSALAALALAACAQAQTLFNEDFQDGNADGWQSAGKGDIRLTTYAGNVSMRLTRSASALIGLKIEGPSRVRISASFAAMNLEKKDACIAEASTNGGKDWTEILRVEDGADDGLSLYKGSAVLPTKVKGGPLLLVRLRVAGNQKDDTCWADNITITALSTKANAAPAARTNLSASFLTGTDELAKPVPMHAFLPAKNTRPLVGTIEGRLSFQVPIKSAHMKVLRDRFGFTNNPVKGLGVPPGFDLGFVQVGERIVPTVRGLIRTDNEAWDIMVEPGRVWREEGDDGFSRVSIPFALQERNANCTHNGVLSFLLKPDGQTSRAAYQIVSETCLYFQYDMWGTGNIAYAPGAVKSAKTIRTAFMREQKNKLPTRPVSALATDHPGLDAAAFGAPSDVSPKAMTTYGVIIDGVHYQGGCETRFGRYPFCENLAIPSYSLAKSIFAGLGMMRLNMLYPEAHSALIETYVPACARAGWKNVTFGHALDMATGRYKSTKSEKDENAAVQDGFFIVPDHKEKIKRACSLYPQKSRPGTIWVYHTTDHYILGTAMQGFLREKKGKGADIYRDLLVEPIWKKLNLSPLSYKTRRTRDTINQPYVGWGLTLTSDDLAKITQFIAVGHGRIDGEDVIDTNMLRAALQMSPADPGLPAPDKHFRYNNGFWAWDAGGVLKTSAPLWIPFMSGFGGISVVLMPNSITYYYISDNNEYAWAKAVIAANAYRPFAKGQTP